ncbi:MAG: hypothetical protein DMG49_26365 [Acidobacteria bacterium]|nr:MAG: hypothetical protein DMG49_26365 [Acidobacteriota bacterium]
MWGNKKPDAPQAGQPDPWNLRTNQPPKPVPATREDKPAMSTDAMRLLGATTDRAMARLGASLHVKGEISGNEDLLIDGSVEGLIQLDERKLTVGAGAKVTADIIAHDRRRRLLQRLHRDRQESRKRIRQKCICPDLSGGRRRTGNQDHLTFIHIQLGLRQRRPGLAGAPFVWCAEARPERSAAQTREPMIYKPFLSGAPEAAPA